MKLMTTRGGRTGEIQNMFDKKQTPNSPTAGVKSQHNQTRTVQVAPLDTIILRYGIRRR